MEVSDNRNSVWNDDLPWGRGPEVKALDEDDEVVLKLLPEVDIAATAEKVDWS